ELEEQNNFSRGLPVEKSFCTAKNRGSVLTESAAEIFERPLLKWNVGFLNSSADRRPTPGPFPLRPMSLFEGCGHDPNRKPKGIRTRPPPPSRRGIPDSNGGRQRSGYDRARETGNPGFMGF